MQEKSSMQMVIQLMSFLLTKQRLAEMGVTEETFQQLEDEANAEIEAAYEFASSSNYPDPATIYENVYANDNERSTIR